MNLEQIEKALKKKASTAPHFQGKYARDTLPRKPRQGFYAVNFDTAGESGSHWVCMHDSYGKKPPPFTQKAFAKFLGLKKRLEKTKKNSFNLTSPLHAGSGAFITYGQPVMGGP